MVYSPLMNAFRQTPEEAGGLPSNLAEKISQGFKLAYEPRNLSEELLAKQLENKVNKPKAENATLWDQMQRAHLGAQTENLGATSGYTREQTKWFGPTAESEIQLRNAQKGLYGAQAQQAAYEAEWNRKLQDAWLNQNGVPPISATTPIQNNQMGQSSVPYANAGMTSGQGALGVPLSSAQNATSMSPLDQIKQMQNFNQNQNAPYGIQTPQMTLQDLANKKVGGFDTYKEKFQQAAKQQEGQREAYSKENEKVNSEIASSQKLKNEYNRFNRLMDDSRLSGPVFSRLPHAEKSALSQSIDQSSQQLLLSGIELMRNAMGNAKFSNLEFQGSEKLKPNRSWGPEARKEYKDITEAAHKRLEEKGRFMQLASNPHMGIPKELADRGWNAYQNHLPFIDSKGNLIHYNKDNWMKFLTPEAVKSLKETGDYNPQDKGKIEVIEKNGKTYKKINGEWHEYGKKSK